MKAINTFQYRRVTRFFTVFIMLVLLTEKQQAQCTWSNLLVDGFEYSPSITSPDFIPGVNYGVAHPDTYAAHSGNQSVYINFVDSNSTTQPGTFGGTLFYRKTINICPNTPYKVSMWFCTTFAGVQCNIKIVLKDATGAVLNTVNNFSCPYAPAFGQYASGVVTPTTSTMILDLYTNVGGCGGNDLGVDDLLIEQCLTPSPGIKTQTSLCATSPTLNLYSLFGTIRPTYGTWAGASSLGNGYLGTFNPSSNLQGQYLYSYNSQNNSHCPVIKDTVNVIVSQTPTLSVNQATICAGQQTATLSASGAANYTWTPSAGLNTTSAGTVNANPSATTGYTIVGANGNCLNTTTTQVIVNPSPVMAVNSATICSGASATLSASGAPSYSWNPALSLNTASGALVTATPPAFTVYTVTGAINSCTATANSSVTVIPSPTLSINSASICTGSEATLTVTGATTYTWLPASALSATSGSTVTSSSPVTITYTVIGTLGNCSDTTQSTVTVNPLPVITVNSDTVCNGFSAHLFASGASAYSWSPVTGLNTVSGASVIATPSVSVNYIITGSLGMCTSTAQATVHVNTLPVVSILASSSIINTPGESVSLTASGADAYLWSNGLDATVISVAPAQTNSYCVTGITIDGCEQKACITIEVSPESTLYIPNTFTPNGDAINDVFYTPGTNIKNYHFVIYNRWGNLLFESNNMEAGWDGTYKGEKVKDDVYNYLLTAEGIDHVFYKKTGSILVLK